MTTRRGLFALLAGAAAAPMVARFAPRAIFGATAKVIYEDFIPAEMFPTRVTVNGISELVTIPVRCTTRLLPMAQGASGFFQEPKETT